jgi:hypothetical protein
MIGRDRGQVREQHQFLFPLTCRNVAFAIDLPLARRRVDDHTAGAAVEDELIAILNDGRQVTEADYTGQLERAGQDGRM